MKEFLYQIFQNPFLKPISQIQYKKTKSKPFSFWFSFCIHIYFSIFFSSGYENIYETSPIYYSYYFYKNHRSSPGGACGSKSSKRTPYYFHTHKSENLCIHFYTFLHFKCRSILMIIIFVINKIYLHNGSVISFFFFYNFYYLFYVCKNSCIFITTVYFHNFFVYFILNHW